MCFTTLGDQFSWYLIFLAEKYYPRSDKLNKMTALTRLRELQPIEAIHRESWLIDSNLFLFVAIHWTLYCIVVVIRSRSCQFVFIRFKSVAHQLHSLGVAMYLCTSPTNLCRCNLLGFALHRESTNWFVTSFCRNRIVKSLRSVSIRSLKSIQATFYAIICRHIHCVKIAVIRCGSTQKCLTVLPGLLDPRQPPASLLNIWGPSTDKDYLRCDHRQSTICVVSHGMY